MCGLAESDIFTAATLAIHMTFYVPYEFSCFLIKAYAEVRIEIRGSTPFPTGKYGLPYAQVRNAIRGGTGWKGVFARFIVNYFLHGSRVRVE